VAARADRPISFFTFFRYGAIVTIVTLTISSVYVLIRYL
jgi:Na+/H+ antiporter NhaD/arsenite permease-like protein